MLLAVPACSELVVDAVYLLRDVGVLLVEALPTKFSIWADRNTCYLYTYEGGGNKGCGVFDSVAGGW